MAAVLRCAVLGMAHDHLWSNLDELNALDGAELCAGADYNPVLRDRFATRTGCDKIYTHYQELLDAEEIDAVLTFSATSEHAEIVEVCAAKNLPVLVEKPMAATLEQASRMLSAARQYKTLLMVNWPTAWNRPLRTTHRLCTEGAIGRIWQITWRGGHAGPDDIGCSEEFCNFLFDAEQNGAGAFNDYSGYGASVCVLFMDGIPQSVMGMAGRLVKTHLPVDDNGILIMRYPQALCRLEMTWTEAVSGQPPHDFAFYGTTGTLTCGQEVKLYTADAPNGDLIDPDPLAANEQTAVQHFVHCIQTGADPQFQTSPDLSYNAQQIMEAGLRSAMSGTEITLPVEDHLFRS